MKLAQAHITIILVVLIAGIAFTLGSCLTEPDYQYIVQQKQIPVEVRIPTVQIQKRIDTVRIVHTSPDSIAIKGLVAVRDSLRKELAKRNVGVLFGLDTITPLRDTIQVTCDEINRRVMARIRFGLRDTTVVYLDTTTIIPRKISPWGLSAGVGAGFNVDNTVISVRPCLFLGLSYTFLKF